MTRTFIIQQLIAWTLLLAGSLAAIGKIPGTAVNRDARKIRDLVIYRDSLYYASFPSVIRKQDGEFLLAFRRAPDRRFFGQPGYSHTDPNSYLVQLRSKDGEKWTVEPELIFAYPFGGSQDPCLLQLKDGSILCSGYAWGLIRPGSDSASNGRISVHQGNGDHSQAYAFLGGYLVRSADGAKSWQGPILPPPVPGSKLLDVWGKPVPAYNRGAMFQEKDGRICWAVARSDSGSVPKTSVHLVTSVNGGTDWQYQGVVASDPRVTFNETSLIGTPRGDLVAFLRTDNMPGKYSCIARSTDRGKTFTWQSLGFYGYPLHALELPDNRILLTYGYRNKPYGIRGRILNSECTDFADAPEFIIRDDGGSGDLGYCWSVMLDRKRVLVVYYFNDNNNLRYIAGTILELE